MAPGHTLVVPRRVVANWTEATPEEKVDLMGLVDVVCDGLSRTTDASGFNIGMNIGVSAGQTVDHLHIHVIPRYDGDVDDPAGGVRFVIPEKGNYRREGFIPTAHGPRLSTGGQDHLLDHLRPWLARADRVDVVAAFVMDSGVSLVDGPLRAALARGARVRVLTGDYMVITQAKALERLQALTTVGDFQFRVVEVDRLQGSAVFHPKAWLLTGEDFRVGFVGSSNLSRSALTSGVEWNLRSTAVVDEFTAAFDDLWALGTAVDTAWLEAYRERAERLSRPPPFDVPTGPGPRPTPKQVQQEALAAIEAARQRGSDRALVVLATGMGKTFLAAFDVDCMRSRLGRMPRTLFVAHRRELLVQAATTFRRLFRQERMGWMVGPYSCRAEDVDIVFASVQKLSRPQRLLTFNPEAFDYIIIDEVHHAAAESYRLLLEHFHPAFWLGLTATPERADARDIYRLFHDEVPFEADIGEGINLGVLVPFDYFGIQDTTDYAPIPWKGRWDPKLLSAAVQTTERMAALWAAWQAHPGSRSLVFCCSIAHCEFVRDWLADQGVRALSVHSKGGDREAALADLVTGDVDAVCAVDLFNEGVDIPSVDRVVMLRPTESGVLFLQQLGRGLRTADGKDRLTVLDFVGNHKTFLQRIRTLLNLTGGPARSVSDVVRTGSVALPAGCNVHVDLGAVDLLKKLLPSGARHAVKRVYQELREERGARPTAGELARMGLNPKARGLSEHWLAFVLEQGDLTNQEARLVLDNEAWFKSLQTTGMTKSFKMVTLLALIEEHQLTHGMPTDALATCCLKLLKERPDLFRDLEDVQALPNPRDPDPEQWQRYWRTNPLTAWSRGAFFDLEDGWFTPRLHVSEADRGSFRRLTEELVDWRLAAYRRRNRQPGGGSGFVCKVFWNKRNPILKLDRGRAPQTPRGFTDVVIDGRPWVFKFVKIAVNTARPLAATTNQLPDLLRGWFGPMAGQPSTAYCVRFSRTPDGWTAEPVRADVVELGAFRTLPSWPELRAAAGWSAEVVDQDLVPEPLALGEQMRGQFAVRAHGASMDGGLKPIRDGDWVLLDWARRRPLDSVVGQVALVQSNGAQGATHHLKKVVIAEGRVELVSSNPAVSPVLARPGDQVIAVLRGVVQPEHLAPQRSDRGHLAALFPWTTDGDRTGAARIGGHLFLFLERGQAQSPTTVLVPTTRNPSETAYVLRRESGGWVYLGIGRAEDDKHWTVPELDYAAWMALKSPGTRGGLSRPLPSQDGLAAKRLTARLRGAVRRDERSVEVLEQTPQGGLRLRLSGGALRTVSLTDIGWVLNAIRTGDETPDEAAVNRRRYIEGTPRASTRWIDTGHAITLVLGS